MGLQLISRTGRGRTRLARPTCGFTLIEIIIVLLITGILAAVAAPKYAESLESFRLQAATARIAGDLRYARRMAQQNSAPQAIVFDIATSSYTLSGITDINRHTHTYQFSLGDLEYECELVSVNFGGTTTLTFDVYGRPTGAGSIVIRCGAGTATLTLDDVGQVSVS